MAEQRLGIFGGTFDPVHFGHLRPAVELVEHYGLDTLYLLPNHRPAHRGPVGASTEKRIAMLQLAIEGVDQLAIDTREALHDRPSYTFNTLLDIREQNPQATLLFFMGMDAFARFDTWYRWGAILELANLVILTRPGAEHSEFSAGLLARQRERHGAHIGDGTTGVIEQCSVTAIDISATDIRRRIAGGLSVQFLLPDTVMAYILRHRLYKHSEEAG